MRITAPVTDYMKRSLLTAVGDLVIGDPLEHDRLPAVALGQLLFSKGVGTKPVWNTVFEAGHAIGDLWVRSGLLANRLPAGASGTYLKGKGAATLPAYEALRLDDVGVKIGSGNKTSSGDQVISGIGYQSSLIIFFAGFDTFGEKLQSWGFDDGTVHMCLHANDSGPTSDISTTLSVKMYRDGSSYMTGYVSAVGADGFTITWVKSGNVNCDYLYLCLP